MICSPPGRNWRSPARQVKLKSDPAAPFALAARRKLPLSHSRSLPTLRILLIHEAPRDQAGVVRRTQALRHALDRSGHEAQVLSFYPLAPGDRLNDREWAAHCDALRVGLDAKIAHFDPHLIHVEQSPLLAHIALEAGVPYVLHTTLAALANSPRDERWQEVVENALDNAGRILLADENACQTASQQYPDVDADRWVALSVASAADDTLLASFVGPLYRAVLIERFGEPIRP